MSDRYCIDQLLVCSLGQLLLIGKLQIAFICNQNLWLIWRDLVFSSLCKCLSVIINTKTSGSGNGLADMSVRLIVPPKMCRLLVLCALILLYSSVFKLCTDNTSGGPPPFFISEGAISVFSKKVLLEHWRGAFFFFSNLTWIHLRWARAQRQLLHFSITVYSLEVFALHARVLMNWQFSGVCLSLCNDFYFRIVCFQHGVAWGHTDHRH